MRDLALDDLALADRALVAPQLQQLNGRANRRQRISQLVAEHRQELVLGATGGFRVGPRGPLRRVQLGPFECLRAQVSHGQQDGAIPVIEAALMIETNTEHSHEHTVRHERQSHGGLEVTGFDGVPERRILSTRGLEAFVEDSRSPPRGVGEWCVCVGGNGAIARGRCVRVASLAQQLELASVIRQQVERTAGCAQGVQTLPQDDR